MKNPRTVTAGLALVAATCSIVLLGQANDQRRVRWLRFPLAPDSFSQATPGATLHHATLPDEEMARMAPGTRWILFEDGASLPRVDAALAAREAPRRAAFAVEGSTLWLSTGDGTDPRTNGREYRLDFLGVKRPRKAAVLAAAAQSSGLVAVLMAVALLRSRGTDRRRMTDRLRRGIGTAKRLGASCAEPLRRIDPIVLWCAAPPILMACLGSQNLFFDRPGLLDSPLYFSYFLHYHQHADVLENYYKVSRLPFILPAWGIHRCFDPIVASYAFNVLQMVVANVAVYLVVKATFRDRLAAVVSALLVGTYPFLHGVGGWNYHMTVTVAYWALASWCLERSLRSSRARTWLVAAGAAIACAVQTHLFMLALGALQVLHWAAQAAARRSPQQWWGVVWISAGGVAALVLLDLTHMATGGTPLAFMQQVEYVMWLSANGNPWWRPFAEWGPSARYMAFPVAMLVLSLLVLLWSTSRNWRPANRLRIAGFPAQWTLLMVLCGFLQSVRQQTIFQPHYHIGAFVGLMFLSLAPFVHLLGLRRARRHPHWTSLAVLTLMIGPRLLLPDPVRAAALDVLDDAFPPLRSEGPLLPLVLALLAFAVLATARRARGAFLVGILLLSSSMTAQESMRDIQYASPRAYHRDMWRALLAGHEWFYEIDPTLMELRFWFDRREMLPSVHGPIPIGRAFDSLASLRGWLRTLVDDAEGRPIEELTPDDFEWVTRLGLLSSAEAAANREREMLFHLGRIGREGRVIARRVFEHRAIRYHVTMVEVALSRTRPEALGPTASVPVGPDGKRLVD